MMWVQTKVGSAYVPDRLVDETIASLPDSEYPEFFAALAELTDFIDRAENSDLCFQLLLRRDAQMFSTRVIGRGAPLTYVTFPFVPFHIFDTQEALNYAQAAQYSWESRRTPWSKTHLRAVHKRICPLDDHSGLFRTSVTGIGPRGARLEDATILLTPDDYVERALAELDAFASCPHLTHRLAACAMIHFQLIAIHPFCDGNGRVARATLAATLKRQALIQSPCLFASEWLLKYWVEYYTRIESVQRHGEITAWVRFFVDILRGQLRSSLELLTTADTLRRSFVERFHKMDVASDRCRRIVEMILLSPTVTLGTVAAALRMSRNATHALIEAAAEKFRIHKIVDSAEPVYQFADIHEALML